MNRLTSEQELAEIARQLRLEMLRSLHGAGSGHPGGSLSIAEILSVLYFSEMNLDPDHPEWEDRDRFILSKGHAAPALYAALALRGYFDRAELGTLRRLGSRLQGHPDRRKTPGVDMSTGSLGQGLSAACGMAFFAQQKKRCYRVFCLMGDGELQEGQIWEAVMAAAHLRLGNLVAFVDQNHLQIDGPVEQVMNLYPLAEKFSSFGWRVYEVDGHSIPSLLHALSSAREVHECPTVILCKTTKGKGISFMENQAGWHGAPIDDIQYQTAKAELDKPHQDKE